MLQRLYFDTANSSNSGLGDKKVWPMKCSDCSSDIKCCGEAVRGVKNLTDSSIIKNYCRNDNTAMLYWGSYA